MAMASWPGCMERMRSWRPGSSSPAPSLTFSGPPRTTELSMAASSPVNTPQPCSLDTGKCCGSRMFIPDPRSWFLSIPDLGSRIQKQQRKQRRMKKNLVVLPLFVAPNITKFKIILFLSRWRKKLLVNLQIIIKLFSQKLSLSFQKYGFGIRDKTVLDPGSRGKKKPGSQIRNTGGSLGLAQCFASFLEFCFFA